MANGLSSMGYSIPTALAAHLVDPSRRVIAFVGDGGLGMYLGELETLVRVGARLTIVVLADRSLELIRRAEVRRGVSTESVTFGNPDFAAVGRAFGITATENASVEELERALDAADRGTGVHLIAAHIDGADYRF
jgi:acetolactate synthase-1/2/3 large subunit